MTFAITDLKLFQFRFLGTQILAYVLIIVVGSQLIFVQNAVNRNLTLVTLAVSIFIALLLIENSKREAEARLKIEALAGELGKANEQQILLIHFITHQIKGFLTKSRNIFAMIKEGDYGEVSDVIKPFIEDGFRSDTKGVNTIQEILNAATIKSGKVSYTMAPFDLKGLVDEVGKDLKPAADAKKLALNMDTGTEPLTFTGDRTQLINAFKNLIDNSIKYTQTGSVNVSLKKEGAKITFLIQDTGVGITPEDMAHLFTEGGHGKDSQKFNVESTGFGLYIVKNIIEAHKGTVHAESEGAGKGSRFIVELPA
jgi:signal transduction histidine kinase